MTSFYPSLTQIVERNWLSRPSLVAGSKIVDAQRLATASVRDFRALLVYAVHERLLS